MSDPNGHHPDSTRVDPALKGDAVCVYSPCHGRQVLLPIGEAVPGAELPVVCPEAGEAWLVAFIADEAVESGLRAVWTQAQAEVGQ